MAENKSNEYAMDTFDEVLKNDPLRILDIGNDTQILLGKAGAPSETERATSNFEKEVEGKSRPLSHTLTDASRILPDALLSLINFAKNGGVGASKRLIAVNKSKPNSETAIAAQNAIASTFIKAGKDATVADVQRSLLEPNTLSAWAKTMGVNEAALEKELMKPNNYRKIAEKRAAAVFRTKRLNWRNKLKYNPGLTKVGNEVYRLEDGVKSKEELIDAISPDKLRDAMYDDTLFYNSRIAKKLKESPEFNDGILEAFESDEALDFYRDYLKTHYRAGRNIDEVINARKGLSSVLDDEIAKMSDKIVKRLEDEKALIAYKKANNISDDDVRKAVETFARREVVDELFGHTALRAAKALGNKELEENAGTIKPNYYTKGLEQDPVMNFIASMFDRDMDDPARFNQKEVDAYWEFLKDAGRVDPKINPSARQKVSVMRGITKDQPELIEMWKDKKSKYLGE